MKFSDVVADLKKSGLSEAKALEVVKTRLAAKGHELTPVKMQLFHNTWETTEAPVVNKPQKTKKERAVKPSGPVVINPLVAPSIDNADELFKALATFGLAVIAWTNGVKLDPIRQLLSTNKPTLDSFFKNSKMNTTAYNVICGLILEKKAYSADKRKADVTAFGNDLKGIPDILSSRQYKLLPAKVTYLKNIAGYLKSSAPTDNAYKNIVNKASSIRVPQASALFTSHVAEKVNLPANIGEMVTNYKKLNKKFGGNEGYTIPTDTLKKYRDTPTKEYTNYCAIEKDLNAQLKLLTRVVVDSSGQQTMDVEDFKKQIKAKGFDFNKVPVGFIGRIDAQGKFYTKEGYLLKDQPSGVIKTMSTKAYNSKDGTGAYCVYLKAGGKAQRCYTMMHHSGKREDKKQDIVDDFIKNMVAYRKHWMKDLKAGSKILTDKAIAALVIEIMFQLCPRPGYEEHGNNKKFENTKGFIYLTRGEVKLEGNDIHFKYTDKNGPQHLIYTKGEMYGSVSDDTLVVNCLKKLMENKDKDEYLWKYSGDNVDYDQIKNYARSVIPGFNLHKFRNSKASMMAKDMLGACKLPKGSTPKEVSDYYMDVMTKVGEELGHRSGEEASPSMAISSYVLKSISNEFFDRYDVSPTQKIAAQINTAEASSSGLTVHIGRRKS
jgi:hypothetical protein